MLFREPALLKDIAHKGTVILTLLLFITYFPPSIGFCTVLPGNNSSLFFKSVNSNHRVYFKGHFRGMSSNKYFLNNILKVPTELYRTSYELKQIQQQHRCSSRLLLHPTAEKKQTSHGWPENRVGNSKSLMLRPVQKQLFRKLLSIWAAFLFNCEKNSCAGSFGICVCMCGYRGTQG